MANIRIIDGNGDTKYLSATGAGSDGDPFIPAQAVTIADGGGSITVDGPLTDTQLRAADVPVSGPLTDTELRAADVKITLDSEAVAIASIAAGDNNIGNVDIASFPTVTMTTVTGTAASSGDNTLIAAPSAGNRIVVHDLQLQLEAATATTMLVKSGSTTRRRFYAASAGDGLLLVYDAGKEFRLGTAEALILNLSGANSTGYTVRYTTEAA